MMDYYLAIKRNKVLIHQKKKEEESQKHIEWKKPDTEEEVWNSSTGEPTCSDRNQEVADLRGGVGKGHTQENVLEW